MFSNEIFCLTCSVFILLPPGLVALVFGSIGITDGCGCALGGVFFGLLYPLCLPAASIYFSDREVFWGEDEEDDLAMIKILKIFEHLGQYFLFSISKFKSSDIQERPAHS